MNREVIKIKVLSLFDGMSCGMLAMIAAGIDVERYDAYEIDKYAVIASKHNFPQIEQHGDVFEADFTQYRGYDFLIGGSPCTYWSIAQRPDKRETVASGLGWELFSQYVRALRAAQPLMFLYENNKSMSKDIRESITEAFGFEPICINSALVSAQNRQRLYWVGVRNEDGTYRKASIEQPADRGILLKDVLDSAQPLTMNSGKGYALTASYGKANAADLHQGRNSQAAEPVCVASRGRNPDDPSDRTAGAPTEQRFEAHEDGKTNTLTSVSKDNLIAEPTYSVTVDSVTVQRAIKDITARTGEFPQMFNPYNRSVITGKSPTLSTGSMVTSSCATIVTEPQEKPTKQRVYTIENGMIEVNGRRYPIKLRDGKYIIRKLTVDECKRLQTVPEWYDFSCVSNTQAYKMLGNGWTVEVIAHLIRGAIAESENPVSLLYHKRKEK